MSADGTFKFICPPECPVFEPNVDEFEDAFKYIEKIKSVGEKYGLCKIRPPPSWKPPFMVDHSSFKFTPRIQKLNEIEATSRVRVMFMLNLAKFWQLQGFDLKMPIICGKHLDFFRLKKTVEGEGGFENVCKMKMWPKIARSMQLAGSKVPSQLKHHYEKNLYPYDIFLSGMTNQEQGTLKKPKNMENCIKKEKQEADVKAENAAKKRKSKVEDEYVCRFCGKGDNDEVLLLCDGCDGACHTFCLTPPLPSVPKGDWRCPSCVAAECSKPSEAYGFEQSEKEYTLESFTKMANDFKEKYFSAQPKSVSCARVEEEFWRILSGDADVVVQYGADNPAGTCGSGFPTINNFYKGDEKYVYSSWNLNNLPVLPSSVLRYIEDEVSGMKVPWCYVGMAFSCFSWHTEDHWSYSVNYMHWGEPKTWYGVPGSAAEKLETCMIQNVPELFQHSPDLMHQLTTLLNPNLLMEAGVPITRTDQQAGEFIITFPRAYHAGFNQGINFAEAVNYCPPDWIEYGRGSVQNYKAVHRQCVFSLDELFVSVGRHDNLDMDLVAILCEDLEESFRHQSELQENLRQQGLQRRRQEVFEKLSDDERQCHSCCTTCFLFSVICSCSQSIGLMSCLEHAKQLCNCPLENKMIMYRYESSELDGILLSLKRRRERWKQWLKETEQVLLGIGDGTDKPDLSHVKDLLLQFKKEAYPECQNHSLLAKAIKPVEEFLDNFKQTFSSTSFIKTRNRAGASKLPTIADLERVLHEIENLSCRLPSEMDFVAAVLSEAKLLQGRMQSEVLESTVPPSLSLLQELTNASSLANFSLEEVDFIPKILAELEWYDGTDFWASDACDETRELAELQSIIASGDGFSSTRVWFSERLERLRRVMRTSLELRDRASSLVSMVASALLDRSKEVHMEDLELLVADSKNLKVHIEDVSKIKNICSKVNEWKSNMQLLLERHHKIHLEELEEVLKKARTLPVNLKVLDQLRLMWQQGCKWRSSLRGVIRGMKQTPHSLMTKLFHHAPSCLVFQDSLTTCDMSIHFQQCKAECSSAIENIRRYNEKRPTPRQQSVDCQSCGAEIGSKFHRCPVCRAPSHEKCLVDYYTSDGVASGCPSCQMNKCSMRFLTSLVEDYRKLNICMWDGEVLSLLLEYAGSWQALVASELETAELRRFCRMLVFKKRLLPRADLVSVAGDDSDLLNQTSQAIKFPKATLEKIINLLLCGQMLDVDLDLCNVLSCLVHSCQIPSIRAEVDHIHADTQEKSKRALSGVYKKMSKATRAGVSLDVSKSHSNRGAKRKRKCDECSFVHCKKPKGRKVDWVQCDKCDLWYHLICLDLTLENLQEDLDYSCPSCSVETAERYGDFDAEASS